MSQHLVVAHNGCFTCDHFSICLTGSRHAFKTGASCEGSASVKICLRENTAISRLTTLPPLGRLPLFEQRQDHLVIIYSITPELESIPFQSMTNAVDFLNWHQPLFTWSYSGILTNDLVCVLYYFKNTNHHLQYQPRDESSLASSQIIIDPWLKRFHP